MEIRIKTPRWSLPFLQPSRYKAAKGGRGSGKSHFFAELMVEKCVADPDLSCVCIREIQKSLKFSAKKLIENKIRALGVSHLFDITLTEIRRKGGEGIIIFQGMQDHTADSIKSLEGFDIAWVEEAQSLSLRSLTLLRPTIRKKGSEIWFSWNPDQPEDPVDDFFCGGELPDDTILAHINYYDNPFLPDTLYQEMLGDRKRDPDGYAHIWLGEYNKRSEAQIFHGKWIVDDFEPQKDWDMYYGADWGFSQDPTTLLRCYIHNNKLYIHYEFYKIGLEISDTAKVFSVAGKHKIRADSSRPETISHVKKEGINIEAAEKWSGSVEDGIAFMRNFDQIIIHSSCKETQKEFRLYSYKVDKHTGDILTDIVDAWNHCIDAIRYALAPLIKRQKQVRVF